MKYFKFILFPLIMFFCTNVYAQEYNVSSSVTSPSGGSSTGGRYEGTELNGSTGPFSIGTRYNGTLTRIRYNIPVPSGIGSCYWTNMNYKVTMYMATEDWRNRFGSVKVSAYGTNYSGGKVTYVSYKKIYFNFKIPSSESTCIDYVLVDLPSNGLFNPFTGDRNWNLSKITITDSVSSGGSSGGGSNPTPTPSPDIAGSINANNNQNTQSIIDNNNSNTQDIIDNNNENTQKVIDNQNELLGNKCTNILDVSNVYQNNVDRYQITDGALILNANNNWQNVMYQIPVENGKHYYFSGQFGSEEPNSIIISLSYNGNNPSDLLNNQFFNYGPTELSSIAGGWSTDFISDRDGYVYLGIWATKGGYSNNAVYYKMMFSDDNKPYCVFGSSSSKIDDTTNAVNRVNDTLNNDNIDNGLGGSFFSGFNSNDFGLSSIITIPLNTIQSLTSQSCVTLNVPIPFTNGTIPLPCMTAIYEQNIPTVYNLWKIVSFGIIAYFIVIDIFHMVKGFKDPESDKVEVLDL